MADGRRALQAGLDTGGECSEVGDARDFIVRKLDAKMVFEARKEIEGLEAVNAELLEEIIAGGESPRSDIEMPMPINGP